MTDTQKETFTLVLKGSDFISGTKVDGKYFVNWYNFLPKGNGYESYRVKAYFKTYNATGIQNDTLFIYSSLASSNNNFLTTTKSGTSLIGIAEGVNQLVYAATVYSTTSYYKTDSPFEFTINYPTETTISIKILDSTGAVFTDGSLNDYVLILTFTMI